MLNYMFLSKSSSDYTLEIQKLYTSEMSGPWLD